jgi:spheroidene monooxygenase
MTILRGTNATTSPKINGVVVVLLFDFLSKYRNWAWLKLMQGSGPLFKAFKGLKFAKVMGSGEGGGFGLRPSATHQGLILVFDSFDQAVDCLKSKEINLYREKTREIWQGVLRVNSCRGSWDDQSWLSQDLSIDPMSKDKVIPYTASLTRASIRATKAIQFWRFAPQAQQDLQNAQGCELAIGLGEAPLVRQCTFSIWRDAQSLVNYAHHGAHLKAIKAAQSHHFFNESMFVRMDILHMHGQWMGKAFNANALDSEALALNL